MIEIRVKFSDNDEHIHIFKGDGVIPDVTMHHTTNEHGTKLYVVEERTEDGERVVAKGYGNYHDLLGIAVGTAAERRWEHDGE